MPSQFIFKFAKNLTVGDLVVPPEGEPMAHAYWRVQDITPDLIRYEVGYGPPGKAHKFAIVGNLNDVVIVRPTAPLHIRPEMFAEYYGPNGFWTPWPWDYKKPMWQLRQEIGEDMTAEVYRKWQGEAYNKRKSLPMERPELVIRTMHDRAVQDFYKNPCLHENADYHGDTNPVTYKCKDCGAFFSKD